MKRLCNKQQLVQEDWTKEMEQNLCMLKSLFLKDGGPVQHFFLSLGDPGTGKFILHIDYSKWGMAGVLYQCQSLSKQPVFIGAVGSVLSMNVIIIVVKANWLP